VQCALVEDDTQLGFGSSRFVGPIRGAGTHGVVERGTFEDVFTDFFNGTQTIYFDSAGNPIRFVLHVERHSDDVDSVTGKVAWRLGVKPQEYRDLEAGTRSPDFETWDRICKRYGWPQTFLVGS
jgi:hypothetical protein